MEATYIRRKKDGRINIKSGNKVDQVVRWTLILLTVLTIVAFIFFNYAGLDLSSAITDTANNLKVMFFEPALSHFNWGEATYQVGITLGLAFLATIIGAIIAFFLSLMAATNLVQCMGIENRSYICCHYAGCSNSIMGVNLCDCRWIRK